MGSYKRLRSPVRTHGKAQHSMSRQSNALHGTQGEGPVRLCKASWGLAGIPRRGKVVRGTARHGSQGLEWSGLARQGQQGAVRLRLVGQGMELMARLSTRG